MHSGNISFDELTAAASVRRQYRFYNAPSTFLTNQGISYLIGLGIPSCQSQVRERNTSHWRRNDEGGGSREGGGVFLDDLYKPLKTFRTYKHL